MMVELAAVNYPFEYEKGIVLKGFRTMLVPSAKWNTESGLAIQWHFIDSLDEVELSELTDDKKYHIWNEAPQLETVRAATRTFLGWSYRYEIKLRHENLSSHLSADVQSDGKRLTFKSVAFNMTLGKAPFVVGVNTTFEVQDGSIAYPRPTEFHEMIIRSKTSPVLLFAPDEGRGWLVPRIKVLECMTRAYIGKYGETDKFPPGDVDLGITRKLLLEHLQDSELKATVQDCDQRCIFVLRDSLYKSAERLDWAEEQAHYQLRYSPTTWVCNKIHGLDFYKLAMRDDYHDRKSFSLPKDHGGWVQLLGRRAVKGVLFCKGLGDVIVSQLNCVSCNMVPKKQNYLAAEMSCLIHLAKNDNLPRKRKRAPDFEKVNFESCRGPCCSFRSRVHEFKDVLVPESTCTDHENGVVVFGDREAMRPRQVEVVAPGESQSNLTEEEQHRYGGLVLEELCQPQPVSGLSNHHISHA